MFIFLFNEADAHRQTHGSSIYGQHLRSAFTVSIYGQRHPINNKHENQQTEYSTLTILHPSIPFREVSHGTYLKFIQRLTLQGTWQVLQLMQHIAWGPWFFLG